LSSVRVESYMSFPFFQKYSEILGVDLTTGDFDDKKDLKLKKEEANAIFENTGCQKLEDYIIELGENSEEFQKVIVDILGVSPRTNQFLTIIREMWVECNVLRQVSVFLRQCFTDPVSRAILTNGKDKNSKYARSIAKLTVSKVVDIKNDTNGTVNTLEDIVYLFVEHETYKFQRHQDGIKKVDKFWENVKNFIVERLARKQLSKRDNMSDEKLLDWIDWREPELTVFDLPEYNKKRIENEDVLEQLERNQYTNVNASRTTNVFYSTNFFNKKATNKPVYDTARDEVWKPMVWLHQKQLVDDFIFFTILHELCWEYNQTIAFNLKQCFVNFIIGNMPVLLTEEALKSKKYVNFSRKNKNWEQPLDIGWNRSTNHQMNYDYEGLPDPPKQNVDDKTVFKPNEWKYLYKNVYDKILLPITINNHYEYFKLYTDWGSDINIQDFQGWTPLHWAAYCGNIDILKYLWDIPNAEIEVEDDEHRTALLVAIESGNVLGNENTTSLLLEVGSHLDKDIWDKLLILAADHDLIVYPRIAIKQNILSLRYKDEDHFSIHKVIKCEAINLLQYICEHYDRKSIKRASAKKDYSGKTAVALAEKCENKDIKKELEEAIRGVEFLEGSDSDTLLEDEIIQSVNEDVLVKLQDTGDSMHTPVPRKTEREYLRQMKEEFNEQYKKEMMEKEDTIKQLKNVVV